MSANALCMPETRPVATPSAEAAWSPSVSTLRRLSLGMLTLGVIWRLARYALQFPIWGDEAFVCVNLLDRDYLALTGPLKCGQIAPLLFLWGELSAYRLFGDSEFAVRLLPLLAGLLALPLFWRLAWRTLPPLAAALAVSVLAVAYWPVTMSGTVKPYTLDLLMTLTLLVLATEWLDNPEHPIWLALLVLVCPIALFASFPAVFVAGAVSLALLPEVWRRRGLMTGSLYGLYNLGMITAFLTHFLVVGMNQLRGADGHVDTHYRDYWANGFPPADPWELGQWLVLIHTGRMFAYPIGSADGGSVVTFILVVIGLTAYLRMQPGSGRLLLLLTPFALNFIAGALRKYPYGGCCRLSQHLAPAICMLMGLGVATLLERFTTSTRARKGWIAVIFIALGAVMIGGLVRDIRKPYKSQENLVARAMLQNVFAKVGPNERVVVLNDANDIDPVSAWWVARFGGSRVEWNPNWQRDGSSTSEAVWTLNFYFGDTPPPPGQRHLPAPPADPADPQHIGQFGIMHCQTTCWRRSGAAWTPVAD